MDDDESSIAAFEKATRTAFREALPKGLSILLEPVMAAEVAAPACRAEAAVRTLEARRGLIRHRGARGSRVSVAAEVPLAEMLGAAAWLPALVPGAALATGLDRFAPVPRAGAGHDTPRVGALRA